MKKKRFHEIIGEKYLSGELEVWKPVIIDGVKTNYAVSNFGNIRSEVTQKMISQTVNRLGYRKLKLVVNGNILTKTVHRLVAQAFIPNPENKPMVNHKDGDKQNNYHKNLEWVTAKENTQHAISSGLSNRIGSKNPKAILSENDVAIICKLLEDGHSISAVSSKTKISQGIIRNIRCKGQWKHISKNFKIDNSPVREHRPAELKRSLIKIIFDNPGITISEVMTMAGLEDSELNRNYVGLFRRRLLKRSTTIQHDLNEWFKSYGVGIK